MNLSRIKEPMKKTEPMLDFMLDVLPCPVCGCPLPEHSGKGRRARTCSSRCSKLALKRKKEGLIKSDTAKQKNLLDRTP